jgi:uncharacterized protein YndB with AHSA1/START domain
MSDTELRVERLIAAPPERVFAHWAEPALLVKWFGPEGMNIADHAIDVKVGGKWHAVMASSEGRRMGVGGVYRVIEPPRRLVFTWAWDDADGKPGFETEVTVTFAAAPGGTQLVILQKEFETAESRDQHSWGWNSTLNCLERLFK